MSTISRGRPPSSSREILADAACELFLEQGYEATSVTEITRRTGVSRSSFFNYFSSKSEILWYVLDRRVAALIDALDTPGITVPEALESFIGGEAPGTLALAIVDARTMRVEEELAAGRAARQLRIGAALAARMIADGVERIRAEILAAGFAGALIAAVWAWAERGAGRNSLDEMLTTALDTARQVLGDV